MTTHMPQQTRSTRTAGSYGRQVAAVLTVAFGLSATHTTYAWLSDLSDPSFTVTTPVAWVFYVVGFGSAALALRESVAAQWLLAAYLTVLSWVAVFWYPTTFTQRQQTTFGWFENDVYTALLLLALYLTVQRLRGFGPVRR